MDATLVGVAMALIARAKQKADEIFKAYSDIDEIFITSDLQGFTEEERAKNHADYLSDKRIFDFQRNSDFEDETPSEDGSEDGGEPSEDGDPEPKSNEPTAVSEVPNANGEQPNADSGEPIAESNKPASEDEERTALFAEYEQLFGQKPPHNIGIEKLRAKINEKKQAG